MNYARVIPLVDLTARQISRALADLSDGLSARAPPRACERRARRVRRWPRDARPSRAAASHLFPPRAPWPTATRRAASRPTSRPTPSRRRCAPSRGSRRRRRAAPRCEAGAPPDAGRARRRGREPAGPARALHGEGARDAREAPGGARAAPARRRRPRELPKRAARSGTRSSGSAIERLLKDLLPVVDDLDRALAAAPPGGSARRRRAPRARRLRAGAREARRHRLLRARREVRPRAPRGAPAGPDARTSRRARWWSSTRAASSSTTGWSARRWWGSPSSRRDGSVTARIRAADGQGHRHRPRDHQLLRRRDGGRRGGGDPEQRGLAHHAVDGGVHRGRRAARRADREAAGDHQPRVHRLRR